MLRSHLLIHLVQRVVHSGTGVANDEAARVRVVRQRQLLAMGTELLGGEFLFVRLDVRGRYDRDGKWDKKKCNQQPKV